MSKLGRAYTEIDNPFVRFVFFVVKMKCRILIDWIVRTCA